MTSPAEIALVLAVVAVGSCVQGSIGFGMGLIASPILALVDPALVPGPMVASVLVLTTLIAIRDRAHVDFATIRWAILGCVVGAGSAASVIHALDPRGFALLFGCLVLLAVGLSALGLRVRVKTRNVMGAGALGGFMGTTASIGGPPLALIYQHEGAERFRGTLAAYFIVSGTINLTALSTIGRFGSEELRLAALLVPGVAAGFLLSIWMSRRLKGAPVRPLVLMLSTLAALTLLGKALLGA